MEKCSCASTGYRQALYTIVYRWFYNGTEFKVTTYRCPICGVHRSNMIETIARPNQATVKEYAAVENYTSAQLAYQVTRYPTHGTGN